MNGLKYCEYSEPLLTRAIRHEERRSIAALQQEHGQVVNQTDTVAEALEMESDDEIAHLTNNLQVVRARWGRVLGLRGGGGGAVISWTHRTKPN